jgi:hypothetical protein
MSQAKLPFALIAISVSPLVLSIAVSFVLNPLTDVAVSRGALPHTIAMFDSIDPFTVISVSTDPGVKALAAHDTHIVVAQILIVIAKTLIAFTMSLIIGPLAFINSTYLIDTDALSVSVSLMKFTSIK